MLDSLTPEEVYALLSARIKNTALGLGAVKGAPCTISSIVRSGDTNVVTFQWTGTNGKTQTSTMIVKDGKSAYQSAVDNGFVGTEQDWLLSLQGSGSGTSSGNCDPTSCPCIRYTNIVGSGVAVGGIAKGEKFNNVTIQEFIDRLLAAPYTAPTASISVSCNNLYAIEDTTSITMPVVLTGIAGKKTDNIQYVEFYAGNTLLQKVTANVANGGTFKFNYTSPITATTTFKFVVNDGTKSTTATTTVTVVNSSYVGYVNGGTILTGDIIKSLTKVVKTSKAYKYSNILMPQTDTYHIVYAYPKSFGLLSTIKDGMNFEYIQDYDLAEMAIDGCNYYVYKLHTPVCITSTGFFQQYS